MPRILAKSPGGFSSVDLGHHACRLALAATEDAGTQCLSLVYQYPPSPAAVVVNGQLFPLASLAQVALVRCPIPFAREVEGVAKVAQVALRGGGLAQDITRTKEALTMFRYDTKVREDTYEECAKDLELLVRLYHRITDWLTTGGDAWSETVLGTVIRVEP